MSSSSIRNLAASVGVAAIVAAVAVACGSETAEKPAQTGNPSTSGSSVPISPTEKSMTSNGPNSFSPQVKAPTPWSPRPADCLPDWC